MKRVLLALALAVPLFVGTAFAYASPGSPSGYVNDFAEVLSPSAKAELEQELAAFDASTTNQIAVVTVPNMGGDYIENYAVQLFKEWGVGTKKNDNGVLLLLAIEEHKLRIEVGYGLEGALSDSVAQSIITDMTPLLKAGDYDGAVTLGVTNIEQATQGEYTGTAAPSIDPEVVFGLIFFVIVILQWLAAILGRSKSVWAGGVLGGIGGVIVSSIFGLWLIGGVGATLALIVLGTLFDLVVSRAYQKSKALGVVAPWWSGGRGGGLGGGFGGFGGGSSGGGGASGSW